MPTIYKLSRYLCNSTILLMFIISTISCSKKTSKVTVASDQQSGRYLLSHDSGPSKNDIPNLNKIPNATPKQESKSKYGNPKAYTVFNKRYNVMKTSKGFVEQGKASWYGAKFHGYRTSSGELYDMYAMTAAHKTLPLPTYLEVTSLDNGKKIIVKVNDRGPFHGNRIIDLSYSAANKLDILGKGVGNVEIKALDCKQLPSVTNPEPKTTTTLALGEHFLQVGAFNNKNNAELALRNIKSISEYPVRIHTSPESANNPLFKVQIGPIKQTDDLEQLKTKLASINVTQTIKVTANE